MSGTPSVRDLLPHRDPILLVDRILRSEPPHLVVTEKDVSPDEPCYGGLDPADRPGGHAYPAALLLESFAQSCGILWRLALQARGDDLTGLLIFGAAQDVVFHRQVMPGQSVRHTVRLDQVLGDTAFLSGESFVGAGRVLTVGKAITAVRQAGALAPGRV